MRHLTIAAIAFGLAVAVPLVEAQAQSRAGRGAVAGGLTGAAIGGIASGGRGAAVGGLIGLGTGAMIGGQMERRRNNFYRYNGRCWQRSRNGEFHPVPNRYCR
jgi:outer membrane lipoprotein SlyB